VPAVIDPDFSVFRMVERVQRSSMIVHHRRTMTMVSYEIENATLVDGARTRILAGFQRMSKFLPQVARYTRLAAQAESVVVFGVGDIVPPAIANITYITLKPDDQLAKEWFVLSYGPDYGSALATEEITSIDDVDSQRLFKGLWTFEESMVVILRDWLTSALDVRPFLYDERQENRAAKMLLLDNSMKRLVSRMSKAHESVAGQIIAAAVQTEVDTVIKERLEPALNDLKAEDTSTPQAEA
jgi:DICT domain-containing protein